MRERKRKREKEKAYIEWGKKNVHDDEEVEVEKEVFSLNSK